jgi:CubicO group peptidase (beta-lactamase class C family)
MCTFAIGLGCSSDEPIEVGASASAVHSVPKRYRALVRTLETEREALGIPGAALAIIERGELRFARGFGVKGPTSTEPVDAETLFRVGSLTKPLTAAALLSAAESHALDLDTPVLTWLSDVPLGQPELGALTLHHLLSQQSGLFDFAQDDGPKGDSGLAQFLTSAAFGDNTYFMVEPGSFYNYSNPNFYLAALALQRVDGRFYREVMSRRLFEPLGMQRTRFDPSEVLADGNYTSGAVADGGGLKSVAPDAYDNAGAWGAGFAFSSVVEYARFLELLLHGDGRVLSDQARKRMQTVQVSTATLGEQRGYGYGLSVSSLVSVGERYYKTKLVEHDGEIAGYSAQFMLLPEQEFGFVLFSNRSDVPRLPNTVTALLELAELFEQVPAPVELMPDPERFDAYAGNYEDRFLAGSVVIATQNQRVR